MSRKLRRLRNRLRIDREGTAKVLKRIAERERALARERSELEATRKNLDRSVALRIRVRRDFVHPMGDAWALNIVLYPEEYRYQFFTSDEGLMGNTSRYAEMRGHEAGHKIADVIRRCLIGELKEFAATK